MMETLITHTGVVASGARLGDRYVLEQFVGEGTFGVVWSASDERFPARPIVVKILRPVDAFNLAGMTEDQKEKWKADVVARFEQEAQIVALLSHPNVVAVSDRGIWANRHYFIMERVNGKALDAWLADRNALGESPTIDEVRAIFAEVCAGVQAAHDARVPGPIVHRDLKPANLMVIDDAKRRPRVKVLDFGIARVGAGRGTRADAPMGTESYMAPEQWGDDPAALGPTADVFALGVILVEMLTGRAGPRDDTRWATEASRLPDAVRTSLEALRAQRHEVPPAVWDAAARALNLRPAARFQDAGAFAEAIDRAWRTPSVAPVPAPAPALPPSGNAMVPAGRPHASAVVTVAVAMRAAAAKLPDAPRASSVAGIERSARIAQPSPFANPSTRTGTTLVCCLGAGAIALLYWGLSTETPGPGGAGSALSATAAPETRIAGQTGVPIAAPAPAGPARGGARSRRNHHDERAPSADPLLGAWPRPNADSRPVPPRVGSPAAVTTPCEARCSVHDALCQAICAIPDDPPTASPRPLSVPNGFATSVTEALVRVLPGIERCGAYRSAPHGTLQITVRFGNAGSPADIVLPEQVRRSEAGDCIVRAVQGARMTAFQGSSAMVPFSFRL